MHSLGREGVESGDHLAKGEVRRTNAKRVDFVYMAGDSHLPHHGGHGRRAELLHQVGRDVVRTVGKTPFESYRTAYILWIVGASRSPGVAVNHKGLRHVDNLVTRSHPLLHGKSVEERLDCTADLTLALADIVEFEIAVVRSADVGSHLSGVRLYRHEGGPEYGFIVLYRVIRGHQGVRIALVIPGEDSHLDRLAELRENLGLAQTGLALCAVAVAPFAGLLH